MHSTSATYVPKSVPSVGRDLVGRARELSAIEALLDDVDGLPRVVVIEGEAGIGKTTLWSRAVEASVERGYAVLSARPVEAESELAYTALGDLVANSYEAIAPELPTPQRRALAAALLIDEHPRSAFDPRTIGVAVLSALRLLSDEQPLVLAIDDDQWLDQPSASALSFAARRLRDEKVFLLLARRPPRRAIPAPEQLEARLRTDNIALGPISIGALHAIVVERFGTVLARPQLRRLHELSQGNPLLAIELVRAAEAGRLRLEATEPSAAKLDSLLGTRLDALPAATRQALLAVAAMSNPSMAMLERVVGGELDQILGPAVDTGVLEILDAKLVFSHPLLASAAYGTASTGDRRRMHASLAAIVSDAGERARHAALAAVEPDEVVAFEMERAADDAFRRGAPAAAAELAQLASRLTPSDRTEERLRRTAALAEYLFESGDTTSAGRLLDEALASTSRGRSRAMILALHARISHFRDDVEAGVALHRAALAEAGGDDHLIAGIHEGLAWGMFLMRADLSAAAEHARSAVLAARRANDNVALAEGLAIKAITSMAAGAPAADAMDEALSLEPALLDLRVLRHPSYAYGYVMACTDDLDRARAVFSDLLGRAEDHGDESAIPPILVQLAMVEILGGNWDAADSHARNGYALAVQVGQLPSQAALLSRSALLAALRGNLDAAEGLGQHALSLLGGSAEPAAALKVATRGGEVAVWALGMAALARRRYERACAYLWPLAGTLLDAGMREPGELRFLPDTVEALLAQRRLLEADDLVRRMEDMAGRTRRGTAIGLASRCRALVALAMEQAPDALAAAGKAVDLLADGPPFERARARLVLGELQRRERQRRTARETLSEAIREFDELGAAGWAARARAEAARIGGRTAAGGELTPTESRVAELVTEGLANKEIAHTLRIAQKTVELHLSHIYAKLEIGSRTELVRRLSALPPSSDATDPRGNH